MTRTLLAIALGLVVSAAHADTWTYRGTLNDGGKPANGRYDLRLTLLNGLVPVVKPITLYGVEVKDGQFAASVDFGVDLSMSPALRLQTDIATAQGFVRLGEPTYFDAKSTLAGVCWDTEGNAGTSPATNFIGTTDAQSFVIRTQNTRSLRIEPSSILVGGAPITANLIGGSSVNGVTAGVRGAVIAGGGAPVGSDSNYPRAAPNLVTDSYSTVGGGLNNVAGNGDSDFTGEPFATIAGGESNRANAYSFVGGGERNIATGQLSVISGGKLNTVLSTFSTIGGGSNNAASGPSSTVGGGASNVASGDSSVVAGGISNCAGGDFSWAGGLRAKVRPGNESGDGTCVANSGDANGDNGTFVWADDQSGNFVSSGPRQFLVRAQGGMAVNTNIPDPGAALTVQGNSAVNGDLDVSDGLVAGQLFSVGPAEMLGGVSVTGNVDVGNSGVLRFGSQTRQMLNLFGTTYGIGIQSARVYQRTEAGGGFNWFVGGVHSDTTDSPGAGGTWRMHLGSVGNLLTSTGTIGTLSDARLKDQIHDYTHALDRINALRPVNYHYIDGGKAAFQPAGEQVGFIAQELEQVFPEWVLKGDDGYLQLSMRGFEAVAVRAMQELSAENEALKKRLEALEARIGQ